MTPTQSKSRDVWLIHAVAKLTALFAEHEYTVPNVRIGVGWTSKGHGKSVGQCWPRRASKGDINEIFIVPTEANAVAVLDTLVHELVHAVDDCKNRHGKPYRKIAHKVGLQGPMRSASAGPELKARLEAIAQDLGPYPHYAITVIKTPRKPRRGGKVRCLEPGCDYSLVIRRKLLQHGSPLCPLHGVPMDLTLPPDYDPDEDEAD